MKLIKYRAFSKHKNNVIKPRLFPTFNRTFSFKQTKFYCTNKSDENSNSNPKVVKRGEANLVGEIVKATPNQADVKVIKPWTWKVKLGATLVHFVQNNASFSF